MLKQIKIGEFWFLFHIWKFECKYIKIFNNTSLEGNTFKYLKIIHFMIATQTQGDTHLPTLALPSHNQTYWAGFSMDLLFHCYHKA